MYAAHDVTTNPSVPVELAKSDNLYLSSPTSTEASCKTRFTNNINVDRVVERKQQNC